jgi:hypothetical protein
MESPFPIPGDIAGRLRGIVMILHGICDRRFINRQMSEGGMHSQRIPIQAYNAIGTIDGAPTKQG